MTKENVLKDILLWFNVNLKPGYKDLGNFLIICNFSWYVDNYFSYGFYLPIHIIGSGISFLALVVISLFVRNFVLIYLAGFIAFIFISYIVILINVGTQSFLKENIWHTQLNSLAELYIFNVFAIILATTITSAIVSAAQKSQTKQ